MDRNQSSLVPGWLKGSGITNGSGSIYQVSSSSSSSSSSLSSLSLHPVRHAQNKLSASDDHDASHKSGSEITSSTHFSWSSSNNCSAHSRPYSNVASASTVSVAPILVASLNTPETVALGSSHARTPPLLNVGTQRLEELAIKQSRQLIPVIPSTPKSVVVSPSEKLKPKIGQQRYPSLNQTRGGIGRADGLKTASETRLQVLKPSREVNVVASSRRDDLGPMNGAKLFDSQHDPTHAASSPSRTSSHSPIFGSVESKPGPLRVTVEKRLTAQAQSRNDFFNLIKKKASANSSSAGINPASGPAVSSSTLQKPCDVGEVMSASAATVQGGTAPSETSVASFLTENENKIEHEDDNFDGSQGCYKNGEKHSNSCAFLCPDEEEAAFLRSLGWEESVEEDGGLTEEEIIAFYEECLKLETSVKLLHKLQSTLPLHLHNRSCSDTASA